ncbi:MgtC/SapB family protein [Pseudonocardiaceae bacterium YIM PH 21723]|nr:MgtC/SapB family protein [Pseudonocardiaceae bacterium YIM PH 21723]
MEPVGQGWMQIGELAVAFVLSAAIGLEREIKQKAAGLRTYTIVGFGSALFLLISKYGFTDVLEQGRVVLDPSRVAAQIVSGLGFIGGGIIFVKRDVVRGLTTAASIWLTAAVGTAAGAGLPILAVLATAAYFVIAFGFPPLARIAATSTPQLHIRYLDGQGLLRDLLARITASGFHVAEINTRREAGSSVEVSVQLSGRGDLHSVITELSDLPGVLAVGNRPAAEPY